MEPKSIAFYTAVAVSILAVLGATIFPTIGQVVQAQTTTEQDNADDQGAEDNADDQGANDNADDQGANDNADDQGANDNADDQGANDNADDQQSTQDEASGTTDGPTLAAKRRSSILWRRDNE